MAFVNRDKRRSWSDERFNARIKEVATQHRNHVDTWYKLLSDDIKSRMVKQNVTAVWDGFDVKDVAGLMSNGNDNKGNPYAPSREFFNLVGGRAGGGTSQMAMVPMLLVQSVLTSKPLTS